jgi:hypothetical protein
MANSVRCVLAALLVFSIAARASATTWFPKEVTCPVCHTKNTFLTWGSYGSYIYQWDSKFQLIFWPITDSPTVYTCKKCHLSAFMWDFEQTPVEKHAEILKQIEGVKLDYEYPVDTFYPGAEYLRIPTTQRLLVAEKVYQVLGRDDDFWCQFYRVLGYHYEAEKKQPQADEARRKALAIAEKMLSDKKHEGERKELLYITGAMRHFLKDDAGALKDFREAQGLKYLNKELEAEQVKNYDAYLSDLLRQYVELLKGGTKKKPTT